jgi:AraC-like DNA-binding protein
MAWHEIVRSTASLTDIALNLGFSDLPHLSRSIHVFTGRSPSGWRTVRT